VAGKARARRIFAWICNERATPPGAKRTSQVVQVIVHCLLGCLKKVIVHSDGACHGNPGPGGWAAVLEYGQHRRELSGGVPATTNNRMELQAAIEALSALKEPCEVEFHTDSEYLRSGVSQWLTRWKRNGWRTKSRKPVKNEDLWRALDSLASRHQVKWNWLKGHAGHPGNEKCDQLARSETAKIKKTYSPKQLKALLAQFAASDNTGQSSGGLFQSHLS
jgi:ribonuclease HI